MQQSEGRASGKRRQPTAPNWHIASAITGVHVAFAVPDRAAVDRFYAAAVGAGGRDNGKPGLRPNYHPYYYGAFVLDPDGHNIEAVCRHPA